MTPANAVLVLAEVGIFTSVGFIAVVLLSGLFLPKVKPEPTTPMPPTIPMPPPVVLYGMAKRFKDRAQAERMECGPDSASEHLEHIGNGYLKFDGSDFETWLRTK